jgi:DNA transposition AAA+ family ATPase
VLDYCSRQHVLGLVVGVPGAGKSVAARAYVEDNPDAVLVTMGTRHDSVMAALGQILEALAGDIPPARAASDLHRQLIKFLRYGADAKRFVLESLEDGAGPSLLVIDEAHAMPQAAAEASRDLAEEARVGVAFVANLDLYQKWFPDKAGRRIASEQFVSRIVPRLVLDSVPAEDLRAILAARGISAAAELAFLARIAGSTGRLRAVDNVLNMTAADGLALTLPHLKRAAGMCGHDV